MSVCVYIECNISNKRNYFYDDENGDTGKERNFQTGKKYTYDYFQNNSGSWHDVFFF